LIILTSRHRKESVLSNIQKNRFVRFETFLLKSSTSFNHVSSFSARLRFVTSFSSGSFMTNP